MERSWPKAPRQRLICSCPDTSSPASTARPRQALRGLGVSPGQEGNPGTRWICRIRLLHFSLVEEAALLLHLTCVLASCLKPDQCSERDGNTPCPMKRDLDPAQSQNRFRGVLDSQVEKQNPFSVVRSGCSMQWEFTAMLQVRIPMDHSVCPTTGRTSAAAASIHTSSTIPILKDAPPHRLFKRIILSVPLSPSSVGRGWAHLLCSPNSRRHQAVPRRAPGILPISGHSRAAAGLGLSMPRGVWWHRFSSLCQKGVLAC